MKMLCFFKAHKWVWTTDFIREDERIFGLYQCKNCKEISPGKSGAVHKGAMPMNKPNVRG